MAGTAQQHICQHGYAKGLLHPSLLPPLGSPSPTSVLRSRLIGSTGPLRWSALTPCRGIHSSRVVPRIFVGVGPRVRPRFLRTTVTSPRCRRPRRVLYPQKVF